MQQIYNIKYIDAFYTYKEIEITKLFVHEAYGYLTIYKDVIIITFIHKVLERKSTSNTKKIIKGLIIPSTALQTVNNNYRTNVLNKVILFSNIAVTWRDIVYVANTNRNDCSIMYSEGILYRIETDHIVLKNPETIRINPLPIINHPAKKPIYYIIPNSFITDIVTIK